MFPTLEDLRATPSSRIGEFWELVLNPASLAVLWQCVELGVLDALPPEGVELAGVVGALGGRAGADAIRIAVELGCGLGLIERRGGRLHAGELSRAFLVRGAPIPLLGVVDRFGILAAGIPHLTQAIRDTALLRDEPRRWSGARARFTERGISYYWDSSSLLMRAYLDRDMTRHATVCDLGAGPAGFAARLKHYFPHLNVIADDLMYSSPEVLQQVRQLLEAERCAVELVALDVFSDPLPRDVDLFTLNRVVSAYPLPMIRDLAGRMRAALARGGSVALVDFFQTGDRAQDHDVANLFVHLYAYKYTDSDPGAYGAMLLPHHARDIAAVLREVGFRDATWRVVDPPLAIVEAAA